MNKIKRVKGWTWENVGKRAKKLKIPLGQIACPHCGTLSGGVIYPICQCCDRSYFECFKKTNKQKDKL